MNYIGLHKIREKRRKRVVYCLQGFAAALILIALMLTLPPEKRLEPISQKQRSEVVARWGQP